MRGHGDPAKLAAPVREAIRSLGPNLPVAEVRPMAEVVQRSMARTSVPVLLAAIALLASWVPARRAAGIEPLEAIRYE